MQLTKKLKQLTRDIFYYFIILILNFFLVRNLQVENNRSKIDSG